MNISFIGYGNMAQAIAHGLINEPNLALYASSPSLSSGQNKQGIITTPNNLEIVSNADVIILAIKPAKTKAVLDEIKQRIPKHCLIISVISGLNLNWLAQQTNPIISIVRTMPNIAASVSQSATPLIANKNVTPNQKQQTQRIFEKIGIVTWITNEAQIDAYTALSGSGPAYVFLFMESMVNAAIKLGLDEKQALAFTKQTLKGALTLSAESNKSLHELRETVTSPAGTTAAALEVLNQGRFKDLIHSAIDAAHTRAQELGENN